MCLDDDEEESNELNPSSVVFVDPRSRDVAKQRDAAVSRGKHMCLELGGKYTLLIW